MFYEIAEKALAMERQGKKIVRLNVGDTNLPAPQCAVEAVRKSAGAARTGYGSSAGSTEFREEIARREKCGVQNVVVGPGSKHLIFALLAVLCKKGGSVAFPAPYWPAYFLAAGQLGIKVQTMETLLEGNWQFGALPPADAAIICNPLNPTSTVYDDGAVKKAIAGAAENGTRIILDEAYRGLAFEGIPRHEEAIRVRSFSKEFNMESWRLGYLVAPEEVAKRIIAFNQITATCVAPFVQAAGIACLQNELELLDVNRKRWKARMGVASKAMRKAGFKFAEPQAGMYVFATHDGIPDAATYALRLLDSGVAVASGGDFGGYKQFVRICANQPDEVLEKAIEKMGEAAKG